MIKLLLLLFVLPLGRAFAQTSYVPSTQTLYDKGYQIYFGADVFQTERVINKDSNSEPLTESQSFTRYQFDLGGYYGLTHNLQFGVGARFRHHESTFLEGTEDQATAKSTGLQSIVSSVTYAFKPIGSLRYSLDALYRYTPYSNQEVSSSAATTNLVLGDDGNEYSVGGGATYAFKSQNFVTARAGYRRPGRDLSDEVYWSTEGALVWSSLALIAGAEGIYSMNNDPYEDGERPIYNTGVSGLYNSSNRQSFGPFLGLNVALGKSWRLEFKASQVLGGRSTDIGRTYGIQLIRRVEAAPSGKLDAGFKTYDIEANVVKVSSNKDYVQIDKGLSEDIRKGMTMDFFEFD